MEILEYDQVDPHAVLFLNLHALGWPLTPERAELIRRLDPRPFPFFGIYAVENGNIAGQVLVYRLPMMSIEGIEDVGGVAAVCTHPGQARKGIGAMLLEEAHRRFRSAGMRFSTLGTSQYRVAYRLYRQLGYQDVFIPSATFALRHDGFITTALRAENADVDKLSLVDKIYPSLVEGCLGFTRRHDAFLQMMVSIGDVELKEIWLLWKENNLVGFALANAKDVILEVENLTLLTGIDASEAVSAISRNFDTHYHWVRLDRPAQCSSMIASGYPEGKPTWTTFMVKPLIPNISVEDARRFFQIGTDQFIISPLDVT